eukprot:SAG22_NODE_620_length_8513_cov_3.934870_8_plen_159_part_01
MLRQGMLGRRHHGGDRGGGREDEGGQPPHRSEPARQGGSLRLYKTALCTVGVGSLRGKLSSRLAGGSRLGRGDHRIATRRCQIYGSVQYIPISVYHLESGYRIYMAYSCTMTPRALLVVVLLGCMSGLAGTIRDIPAWSLLSEATLPAALACPPRPPTP